MKCTGRYNLQPECIKPASATHEHVDDYSKSYPTAITKDNNNTNPRIQDAKGRDKTDAVLVLPTSSTLNFSPEVCEFIKTGFAIENVPDLIAEKTINIEICMEQCLGHSLREAAPTTSRKVQCTTLMHHSCALMRMS